MKYAVLVCEAATDDPVEALGGRTPMELAKAPFLHQLAKKGRVGSAIFTSPKLALTRDVAAMAILGYPPEEFYTGVAPLEAAAAGISQDDNEIAFRCDLVTVSDGLLADVSAGFIPPEESSLLIEELNKKLSSPQIKFYPREGYKNILMIRDPEKAESLDELECVPPSRAIGQKMAKVLPKGEDAEVITSLMEKSKTVLEHHEINRVRIDLGENPANMIWPWGQGRRPRLPRFKDRFGVDGAVFSQADFAKGLGLSLGFKVVDDLEKALRNHELTFVYMAADQVQPETDPWKTKIRLIERFDTQVVGIATKCLENLGDHRLLVCTDTATSSASRSAAHGPVPFLIAGHGFAAEKHPGFNEKTAAQSKLQFPEGHPLMEHFLK